MGIVRYVIAVAYQGAVTHHLVEFDDVNAESCSVNGSRVDGASDIAQLITIIQTMPSWWKVRAGWLLMPRVLFFYRCQLHIV